MDPEIGSVQIIGWGEPFLHELTHEQKKAAYKERRQVKSDYTRIYPSWNGWDLSSAGQKGLPKPNYPASCLAAAPVKYRVSTKQQSIQEEGYIQLS